MSQGEIDNLLKKYPKRVFTVKEISEMLGITINTVSSSLASMRKVGWVNFKREYNGRGNRPYLYWYKKNDG